MSPLYRFGPPQPNKAARWLRYGVFGVLMLAYLALQLCHG